MSRFLAICGPSGVGKTSVMQELVLLDERYTYIAPYMTRPLRPGESDKVAVSSSELDALERGGAFLVVNELYGVRYGTPRAPIEEALRVGAFPMIDWPIGKLGLLRESLGEAVYCVYLSTEEHVLRKRLTGRDPGGERLREGLEELRAVGDGAYGDVINLQLQANDSPAELAKVIRSAFAQDAQPSQRGEFK